MTLKIKDTKINKKNDLCIVNYYAVQLLEISGHIDPPQSMIDKIEYALTTFKHSLYEETLNFG